MQNNNYLSVIGLKLLFCITKKELQRQRPFFKMNMVLDVRSFWTLKHGVTIT